jgi:hypothetical protein
MADYDLDALLTWGREWERTLKPRASGKFRIDNDVLRQFLARAIEGLVLLREHEARSGKRAVGRRKGTGLGKEVADLMTAGVSEADAITMVAKSHGRKDYIPVIPVRRAWARYRKAKNTP